MAPAALFLWYALSASSPYGIFLVAAALFLWYALPLLHPVFQQAPPTSFQRMSSAPISSEFLWYHDSPGWDVSRQDSCLRNCLVHYLKPPHTRHPGFLKLDQRRLSEYHLLEQIMDSETGKKPPAKKVPELPWALSRLYNESKMWRDFDLSFEKNKELQCGDVPLIPERRVSVFRLPFPGEVTPEERRPEKSVYLSDQLTPAVLGWRESEESHTFALKVPKVKELSHVSVFRESNAFKAALGICLAAHKLHGKDNLHLKWRFLLDKQVLQDCCCDSDCMWAGLYGCVLAVSLPKVSGISVS